MLELTWKLSVALLIAIIFSFIIIAMYQVALSGRYSTISQILELTGQ